MEDYIEDIDLDEPNEEIINNDGIISDNDILSIEEMVDRIIGSIHLLNHIDDYKDKISKKRREVDWRLCDLRHTLENMEIEDKDKLTIKGCKNIIDEISKCEKMRRKLKVSDELIYEFNKRYNRLNNKANRDIVENDIRIVKKNLTQSYKYRVYNEEDINKIFDTKEEIQEIINNKIKKSKETKKSGKIEKESKSKKKKVEQI